MSPEKDQIRHNDISERREIPDNNTLSPKELFDRAAGVGRDLNTESNKAEIEGPNPFLTILLAIIITAIGSGIGILVINFLRILGII